MTLENGEIDTPIELSIFRLQARYKLINLLFKYTMLLVALIGATVLGVIFDGEYTTYTFVFYSIVITYAIGSKAEIVLDKIKDFSK